MEYLPDCVFNPYHYHVQYKQGILKLYNYSTKSKVEGQINHEAKPSVLYSS